MKAVRWFLGIILWFAGIGEKTLLWTLKHWFYFIGLGFIGLTLLTKWVAFTLSKQIQGVHLSILSYVPGHHVNPLLSYGFIAVVLFVIGVICYSRRYWRLLAGTGATILLLALFAVMQVAFLHSNILKELQDEEIEAKGAADFTKKYMPVNSGSEATSKLAPAL